MTVLHYSSMSIFEASIKASHAIINGRKCTSPEMGNRSPEYFSDDEINRNPCFQYFEYFDETSRETVTKTYAEMIKMCIERDLRFFNGRKEFRPTIKI